MTIQLLTDMLEEALLNPPLRASIIDRFQREVFNTAANENSLEWTILKDLAYDLEFYEADPKLRTEDASYFGDEVAEKEIRTALAKLGIQ